MRVYMILGFLVIIGVAIGILVGKWLDRKPLRIEFKLSFMNGMTQAVLMFAIITLLMFIELILNGIIQQNVIVSSVGSSVFKKLMDQGIVIVLASPIMSIMFNHMIRTYDLDLSHAYDENVIKTYYSLVVLVNCMLFLGLMHSKNSTFTYVDNFYFNRIIMWGLSIFGTWFGIGFRCKGRIIENEENERKSKRKTSTKEMFRYWIPFVIAFMIMVCGYVLSYFGNDMVYLAVLEGYLYLGGIVISIGITMITYARIVAPSERKSDKKLVKAIQLVTDNESCIEGKYRYLNYLLINEDGKKELVIKARNAVWEENEDRVSEKLGEKRIPVQSFDYEACRDLLRKTAKDQTNFIREGFEECKEIAERKMRM